MAATATRGREFVYVGWPVRSCWTMTPQRGAGAVLPRRLYVEAADSEASGEVVSDVKVGSVIYSVSVNYLLN